MNATSTLALAILVSVAAAAATSFVLRPAVEPAPAAAPDDDPKLAAMEADIAELRTELAALRDAIASGGRVDVSTSNGLDEAAVRRLVQELVGDGSERQEPPIDILVVLRDLQNPLIDPAEKAALWEKVRDNGQIEDVVAEYERLAALAPGDANAQTELGWAYQQRMLAAKTGPERGQWGAKGAAQFEKALAIDPTDFDARHSLAQHSYWADMRGDAIQHFETLIEQQKSRTPEPKHAEPFLWLGNIFADRGDRDRAKEVWRQGARLFPNNDVLRHRLDTFR